MRAVSVPVISIGNLTAGGTGKTPLVEMLIELFLAEGKRPVVVSRGYGRQSRGVIVVSHGCGAEVDVHTGGDEPVEIAHRFPSVGVVVGEKRVDAAMQAVGELRPDIIVLDDGFQHRYLKRDLDIVVLDARRDLDRELLLPAGLRREPRSSLRRAGLLVISRAADDRPLPWEARVREVTDAPLVRCRYAIQSLHRVDNDEQVAVDVLGSTPLVAFSGIGHPEGFRNDLMSMGLNVVEHRIFPDHHWYRENDLRSLVTDAKVQQAAGFITTEKDAVRLRALPVAKEIFASRPVCFTRLGVEVLSGKEELHAALSRCFQRSVAG
jgi:tetraacyldisaccharide 4'-kinase